MGKISAQLIALSFLRNYGLNLELSCLEKNYKGQWEKPSVIIFSLQKSPTRNHKDALQACDVCTTVHYFTVFNKVLVADLLCMTKRERGEKEKRY